MIEETSSKRVKVESGSAVAAVAAVAAAPAPIKRPPGHLLTCDADLMIRLRGLPYQC